MAEIPVEKKSGISPLWWLLLLLLAGLLLWWLLSDDDDEIEPVDEDVVIADEFDDDVAVLDDVSVAGPITTVAALTGLATMIGQDVDLSGVRVTELAGDMAFYVGEGDNRTLVLFDETQTPGTPTEGLVDVNVGSMVDIDGEVRANDGTLSDGVQANVPAGTQAYIYAEDIEVN